MIDKNISLKSLNNSSKNSLSESFSIEFVEITESSLKAKMPVNRTNMQQLGMLHGGASAALAETTGSMAAYLTLDRKSYYCVGLELKINHLKAVRNGFVYATAFPLHLGTKTQLWQIKIEDEKGELIAFATHTVVVLPLDDNVKKQIEAFVL